MSEFDEKLNALLSNPDSMAQIMQLAQSLSSGSGPAPPPQPDPPRQTPPPPDPPRQPPPPAGGDPLSGLLGGVDPKLLVRLLPILQELGRDSDSNARQLLTALRPYLRPERQDRVERALQLARLIHLGKQFLSGWEG